MAALVVLALTAHTSAQPERLDEIKLSVVGLQTFGSVGQELAAGSGFFIGPSAIVTMYHIIEGVSAAEVRLASGKTIPVVGIIAQDRVRDVAILALDDATILPPPLRFEADVPSRGSAVWVIGGPHGSSQKMTKVSLSGNHEHAEYGLVYQVTPPVPSLSSGGPIVSTNGDVVGIALVAQQEGAVVCYAIPVQVAIDLDRSAVIALAENVPSLDRMPQDVPDGIFRRLSGANRRFIERSSKYYVRLPDGTCLDAYRLVRSEELLGDPSSQRREKELEALNCNIEPLNGVQPRAGEVLAHENLPGWLIGPQGKSRPESWIAFLERPGFPRLKMELPIGDQWFVGYFSNRFVAVHVKSGSLPVPGSNVSANFILYHTGNTINHPTNGRPIPTFDLLYLIDCVPTPAQLAFAALQGSADLVVHRYSRSINQPVTVKEFLSGGLVHQTRVPSGPLQVRYEWKESSVKLHVRQEKSVQEAPTEVKKDSDIDDDQKQQWGSLVLNDGRSYRAYLVSEKGDKLKFRVSVGKGEMDVVFDRRNIAEWKLEDEE